MSSWLLLTSFGLTLVLMMNDDDVVFYASFVFADDKRRGEDGVFFYDHTNLNHCEEWFGLRAHCHDNSVDHVINLKAKRKIVRDPISPFSA
jgi:hypothetical protein